jgi:hypothetical protein
VEEVYDAGGQLKQYTSWLKNGKLNKRGTFRSGKKYGIWTYWNGEGQVIAKGEWKNGEPWEGVCAVPVAGDAGSLGGLETFSRYHKGKQVEKVLPIGP